MELSQRRLRLARRLALAVLAWDVAMLAIGGALKPGYSHVSQYISELNATGTPWATTIGWLGFVPLGLLLGWFLVVAAPLAPLRGASRAGWWLLMSQPLAYVGAALAPCDAGCPATGSVSQDLHNLLGVVAYPAAGLGLLLLAFAPRLSMPLRTAFVAASVAWMAGFVAMVVPELDAIRGAVQRVTEAVLYLVVVLVAYRMLAPRDAVGPLAGTGQPTA